MLTAMTEENWTIVLRVFAASRSRRGDKGRNDRKFLEDLHYFWFIILLGGLFRRNSGTGTACGSGSGG